MAYFLTLNQSPYPRFEVPKTDSQGPNQRNLRPVVSVGVSTECARLEFEGPHALDKNVCDQKLLNFLHRLINI